MFVIWGVLVFLDQRRSGILSWKLDSIHSNWDWSDIGSIIWEVIMWYGLYQQHPALYAYLHQANGRESVLLGSNQLSHGCWSCWVFVIYSLLWCCPWPIACPVLDSQCLVANYSSSLARSQLMRTLGAGPLLLQSWDCTIQQECWLSSWAWGMA